MILAAHVQAPAVVELLKKFGLEQQGVSFNAFKQGVRAHRMRAKKAVLAAKKANAAITSVDAAKRCVSHFAD